MTGIQNTTIDYELKEWIRLRINELNIPAPGAVILVLIGLPCCWSTARSPTYFLQIIFRKGMESKGGRRQIHTQNSVSFLNFTHLRFSSVSTNAVFLAASCPSRCCRRSDNTTAIWKNLYFCLKIKIWSVSELLFLFTLFYKRTKWIR